GWYSVSIHSAVAPTRGTTPDEPAAFCARLSVAMTHFADKQITRIAWVAIGDALDRARACYAKGLPANVIAVAGLGYWKTTLDDIKRPAIGLVPSGDPLAVAAADRRYLETKQKPSVAYRRVVIDVQDKNFQGGELEAAKHVRGWLAQFAPTTNS
ncbi:MAG: hypothetical protein ACREXT_01050, partial [Gammaproteobacteria bacterium]